MSRGFQIGHIRFGGRKKKPKPKDQAQSALSLKECY